MIQWNDYQKVKPPKFVAFYGLYEDYEEKLIIDRKGLWSEEHKTYIKTEPDKWCIKK